MPVTVLSLNLIEVKIKELKDGTKHPPLGLERPKIKPGQDRDNRNFWHQDPLEKKIKLVVNYN